MASSDAQTPAGGDDHLDSLRAGVTKQAGLVRQLKADGAAAALIQDAVTELTSLRKKLDELMAAAGGDANKWKVNKRALEDSLTRRMFVVPSFEIHGGVAGLFDFGPPGCALKENILAAWRQHFVLADSMLQIECTTLTPHPVLKASGHVDKFEDLMVKDTKTGECYRADKLLEDFVDSTLETDKAMPMQRREELRKIAAQADAYDATQLGALLTELGVKAPATGNALTEPFPFNLMFATSIGPTGQLAGFLRPETAQGMFVNFRRLYDYNFGRMPMAVAQIGTAYRNEIAPRGGLIRVREFTMAEIEHFVHPEKKAHAKFAAVAAECVLNLFPADNQVGDGKTRAIAMGEAVKSGLVNNETLGYFMARTAQFLWGLGIRPEGLRFRQHLRTEMAHYACDCWDAEILMSQGWVECVGHADRSAFDLKVHTKATKVELVAREVYPEPREEDVVVSKLNKGLIGKALKLDAGPVQAALEELALDTGRAMEFEAALKAAGTASLAVEGGKTVAVAREWVSFAVERKRVSERKFVPNVIEPSFGIGRIITGVLEHNFYVREGDEQRTVLSFVPSIAPYKAVLLPLDGRIDSAANLGPIAAALNAAGLATTVDDSGASVGKRYARADELGTPFAVTFDHVSLTDARVTLRERDSTTQVRLPIPEVLRVIRSRVAGIATWQDVVAEFGLVASGAEGAGAPAPAASAVAKAGVQVAAAGVTAAGSRGVTLEGTARGYGRFARPSDLPPAK